ncbi:MAG: hypothetical protein HQL32_16965 [Planctomycetes bacterium]|nr:hypothetical protein [Planctomycetota bacterium]
MIAMNEEQIIELKDVCQQIRESGTNIELSACGKLKKLMNYANKKGISYVIIPNDDESYELKNMESGEQQKLSKEELVISCKGL